MKQPISHFFFFWRRFNPLGNKTDKTEICCKHEMRRLNENVTKFYLEATGFIPCAGTMWTRAQSASDDTVSDMVKFPKRNRSERSPELRNSSVSFVLNSKKGKNAAPRRNQGQQRTKWLLAWRDVDARSVAFTTVLSLSLPTIRLSLSTFLPVAPSVAPGGGVPGGSTDSDQSEKLLPAANIFFFLSFSLPAGHFQVKKDPRALWRGRERRQVDFWKKNVLGRSVGKKEKRWEKSADVVVLISGTVSDGPSGGGRSNFLFLDDICDCRWVGRTRIVRVEDASEDGR